MELIQEWSENMKTASKWNFRSIVGKIMLGLALAAMIGSINVAPAIAKDHDNGRYEHRGRGYDHNRYYRPYGYYGHQERVYYPPPRVIYAPPPPPGIGIFFPPVYIHR
jgi:hypothetical protein